MRIIPSVVFLALLSLFTSPARAAGAGAVHVHALLVIASKQTGPSDPQLASYEPTLRRILRFESYRLAGEGSVDVPGAVKSNLSLGRGHSLELETEKAESKGAHLRVNWQDNGRSLMNTGLALRPGVPAVLGGPSTGKEGEVFAVIIIAD